MINLRLLKNPFFCFILSFGIVLFIYTWGWSDLYPDLSQDMLLFLFSTFIISLLLGWLNRNKFSYKEIEVDKHNYYRILFIFICYLIEIIYSGGIPLLLLIKGSNVDYQEFGIKTFHILVQTLAPFYATYLFHQYLNSKNKILLFYAISLISMSLLIVSRAPIVTTSLAFILLTIHRNPLITKKSIIKIVFGFLIFFYGFGYLGNIRSFKDNEDFLLTVAKATDKFKDSLIPQEYFWLYLYAASPLANFQQVVNTSNQHSFNFWRFMNNEIIPDIIGRRFDNIKTDPEYINQSDYLIARFLTVGTMYYNSYIRMAWWGPIIAFSYYMLFILLYIWLLYRFKFTAKYRNTAIVILCTISIFNIFDNMTREAGLLIQLVYPFLFGLLDKIYFKNDIFRIELKNESLKIINYQ